MSLLAERDLKKQAWEDAKAEAAAQDPMAPTADMSMRQILKLMTAVDEGMAELSVDEMRELAKTAAIKVDSYRYMITKLRSESERLAAEAEPILKASKSLARKADGLESLLCWHLRENKLTGMPGERFRVELRASRSVKVNPQAEAGAYIRYADFMRLKYEWDKNKLQAALKRGDEAAREIAEFEENYSVQFKPVVQVDA
jgi:hypothetical protein